MTASIKYAGNLHCEAQHTQSGTGIETDAPVDNMGKGEKFSPTDLFCVSLATCMLTTMGIKANAIQADITNATAQVTKHMLSNPRRIGKIEVDVLLPVISDEKTKKSLELAGDNCPVIKSIDPNIEVLINYKWGESL